MARAKTVHVNEDDSPKYDYSKIDNTAYRYHNKLTILSPIHGGFQQKADAHLCNNGCPDYGKSKAAGPHKRNWRPFEEAREYVRSLGFKSTKEYRAWSTSGDRPYDIPSNPNITYKDQGWSGWPDFCGKRNWRPFEEAREYVRSLGFKSIKEYQDWSTSGDRPSDIPGNPYRIYKDQGWSGMADYYRSKARFLTYDEARAYILSVGIKRHKDFQKWKREGNCPYFIPRRPDKTYKDKGWISWSHFLGLK